MSEKINVASIGASLISEKFIEACQLTNQYHLKAIYSKDAYLAKDLATIYNSDYYTTEINNVLYDPEIDLIYIASPNSLHYEQAYEAVQARKHVIVEKPIFSNVNEWNIVHEVAVNSGVYVFEGALHIHTRNYRRLKEILTQKIVELEQPFRGGIFNLCKYSPNYMEYLNSIEEDQPVPDEFNPDYSSGALMDLGVYPIYVALDLFGLPDKSNYIARKGPNGIDLGGTIFLDYSGFTITINIAKDINSNLKSELYLDDELIEIEDISRIKQVDLISGEGDRVNLVNYRPENWMFDQLMTFKDLIDNQDKIEAQVRYESIKQLSLQVCQVLEELRKKAGIKFKSDLAD